MILTKNEIPADFRSKLKERLNEAIDNLDKIIKMSAEEITASSELEIGSFVSVTDPKYLNRKGRIWFIKNDIASVNLDGNKNYVNISCCNLTNLSVSGESKREQLIWLYENQIKEIREILDDSKVPDILLSNEYNIVQIPTQSLIREEFPVNVFFVHSIDLITYKVKLPLHLIYDYAYEILEEKFVQIKCLNNDIVDISPSSEIAFKLKYLSNLPLSIKEFTEH